MIELLWFLNSWGIELVYDLSYGDKDTFSLAFSLAGKPEQYYQVRSCAAAVRPAECSCTSSGRVTACHLCWQARAGPPIIKSCGPRARLLGALATSVLPHQGMHLVPRQASQSNIVRPALVKLGIPDATEAGLAVMLVFCPWLLTFLTLLPQPLPCSLGRRKPATSLPGCPMLVAWCTAVSVLRQTPADMQVPEFNRIAVSDMQGVSASPAAQGASFTAGFCLCHTRSLQQARADLRSDEQCVLESWPASPLLR